MVTKERREKLFGLWLDEQENAWRDNYEEFTAWREQLTEEERRWVDEWDAETPTALIHWYKGKLPDERR